MSFHRQEIASCGVIFSVTSVTKAPPAEGPAEGTSCEIVLASVSTISKSSSELVCVDHLRLTLILPSCRNVGVLHKIFVFDTKIADDANDRSPENMHSTIASCGKLVPVMVMVDLPYCDPTDGKTCARDGKAFTQ